MNRIQWQFANDKGNEENIKRIEKIINVKLPCEYIECVLKNNAGYPNKNIYNTKEEKGKVFESLLSISNEDDENVVDIYKLLSENNIKNMIPFGIDPFGNYICFRYRNKNEYDIVLLNHEDNIETFISNSFVDFINKLY